MAKAKNKVISGLYSGSNIELTIFQRIQDKKSDEIYYLKIILTNKDFIIVNEQSIKNVELINKESIQTDTGSSIARGIAGGILLGGAGLVAGAGMGKQSSINTIEITWKDDQKSLLEIDANILSELNKICWNIQNNITGADITKEEILLQVENNNKQAKGCLLSILAIILAFIFPPLWCLIIGYIVYKSLKKHINFNENDNNKLKTFYYGLLYFISILLLFVGTTTLFDKSFEERLCGVVSILIGIILLPPIRAKINAYFFPKFNNLINKNNKYQQAKVNIAYGIIKFFIVALVMEVLAAPSMNKPNNTINQLVAIEQTKTIQNTETQIKKDTSTQIKNINKPVKSENSKYYSVANTLENYYKNYFNTGNWYVSTVYATDKTINVNITVVDPTWQENIKKYSSSRQYMVNCACPNSYTDIWQKIRKSDVSVTIYDVYGKRIGGGVCTN